jgi:hypothetical protein
MKRILVGAVLAACSKAAPAELSTPEAAARCLLAGGHFDNFEVVRLDARWYIIDTGI